MKGTITYLHFNGNCRSAMAYYRECFGGELNIRPYPDNQARVMHSQLAHDGKAFLMASDSPSGTDQSRRDNHFSVFVDCSANAEVDKLFAALSKDGKATVQPGEMPFGHFAMCDDAFGTSWLLNCLAEPGA